MKHTFSEIAPCRQKLELTFDAEEVAGAIDAAYREFGDSTPIKGFRVGKAPRRMIERRYGARVFRDAAAQLVQGALEEALEESKISPLGDPTLDTNQLVLKSGEPFAFSLEIDVRPAIELGEYTGLRLEDDVPPVTEADIDERLQQLARQLTPFEITEEPAAAGDIVEVDARMTVGGEEIVNVTANRIRLDGAMLFGIECPNLVEKLAGARPGAEIAIEQTIPRDHPRENLRGQTANTLVKVSNVSRQRLPAIDEAFATRLQFKSLEELRGRVKEMLESGKETGRRESFERQIVDELVKRHEFPLPEAFVQRQANMQLYQNRLRLARMGVTRQFLDENAQMLIESSRRDAERQLRWAIIADAIAEKEELRIEEAEVMEYIAAVARQQNTTPDKILRSIRDRKGMTAVAAEIRDAKIFTMLINKAEVVPAEPKADADGHDNA